MSYCTAEQTGTAAYVKGSEDKLLIHGFTKCRIHKIRIHGEYIYLWGVLRFRQQWTSMAAHLGDQVLAQGFVAVLEAIMERCLAPFLKPIRSITVVDTAAHKHATHVHNIH